MISVSGAVSQQVKVPPKERREVIVSGPRWPDAGVIGSLGFHVFEKNSDVQSIAIEAP